MPNRYIKFIKRPSDPARKTSVWDIQNVSSSAPLGMISWFAHWRRYCFFPNGSAVYDATCLREVIAFLNEANAAHKGERNFDASQLS